MQLTEVVASSALQDTAAALGVGKPKNVIWGRIGARIVTVALTIGGVIGCGIGVYSILINDLAMTILGFVSGGVAGTGSFCLWKNTPEKELEDNIKDLNSENVKLRVLVKQLQEELKKSNNQNSDFKKVLEDAESDLKNLSEDQLNTTSSLSKIAAKLIVVRNAIIRVKNLHSVYEKNLQDLLKTIKMMFDMLPKVKDQTDKITLLDTKLENLENILRTESKEFQDENAFLEDLFRRAQPLNEGITQLNNSIKLIIPILQNSTQERDKLASEMEILSADNAKLRDLITFLKIENEKINLTNNEILLMLSKLEEIQKLKNRQEFV